MKVYAEYFEENGVIFRQNTILQFGESWELIGNIILANPGSAEPEDMIDDEQSELLKDFYKTYRKDDSFNPKNWYKFRPDPTMQRIEKIFNGGYINEKKELNGVIQLFNIFNIKNHNLEEAVTQIGIDSPLLFSIGIEKYFHHKPTYFGFSQEVLGNDILKSIAENIFNNTAEDIKKLYQKKFDDNAFYHPTYINRAYNQKHFQWYKDDILKKIYNEQEN